MFCLFNCNYGLAAVPAYQGGVDAGNSENRVDNLGRETALSEEETRVHFIEPRVATVKIEEEQVLSWHNELHGVDRIGKGKGEASESSDPLHRNLRGE